MGRRKHRLMRKLNQESLMDMPHIAEAGPSHMSVKQMSRKNKHRKHHLPKGATATKGHPWVMVSKVFLSGFHVA